jgi:pimeloyl-ACP methyl ester carboxylesterase
MKPPMSTVMQALALALLAAMVISAGAATATAPGDTDGMARAGLALRDCPVADTPLVARCGELLVPENPARPAGRRIVLRLMVIPARTPDPGAAPLVEFAGGPGASLLPFAGFYATDGAAYREHRDVVLIDARGTGESSPLRCPELEWPAPLSRMYLPEAVRRCRLSLSTHADPAQYTTANIVADVEAVRAALGYAQLDLFGISYGTRVAQHYARAHPSRVRSMVLIGALPDDAKVPLWHARNGAAALEQTFDDCARDADCAAAFPTLRASWRRAQEAVAKRPTLPATHPSGSTSLTIEPGPFAEAIRSYAYSTGGLRRLPWLIDRMGRGEFAPLLQAIDGAGGGIAEGLYLSVTCAEDTNWISRAERAAADDGTPGSTYRLDEQYTACRIWDVPNRALADARPLPDVPTLLIVGDRDAVTPIAWTRAVAAGLPRSRVIVVPALGHSPDGLENMGCLDTLFNEFYRRASAEGLETGCLASMRPPAFERPARTAAP